MIISALVTLLPKVLLSIGIRMLSEETIEKLLIWGMEKLAASTKTTVDDELLQMVKDALAKKKQD